MLSGTIREACEMAGGLSCGYVSSGCIYTGRRSDGNGFTETDTPKFSFRTNNCSWCSGTKALGEEVLADVPRNNIWRLRIPFGHHDSPRNYLSKVVLYERLLEAENSISHLSEFVAACLSSWQKRIPFGTYNVTNTGHITTRRVTQWITEHLLPDQKDDVFASEEEFVQIAAKTPRSNCVMDNSKLLAAGIEMSTVENAVIDSRKSWKS